MKIIDTNNPPIVLNLCHIWTFYGFFDLVNFCLVNCSVLLVQYIDLGHVNNIH